MRGSDSRAACGCFAAAAASFAALSRPAALLENSGLPCYDTAALIVLSYHNTQLKHSKQRTGG